MGYERSVAYSASGFMLYQRDGTLLAQPFIRTRMAVTGDALPVAEDLGFSLGNGRSSFSLSNTDTLVYTTGSSGGATAQLARFDRTGKLLGLLAKPDRYFQFRLSPDERWIAYSRNGGTDADIWLLDVANGIPSRFYLSLDGKLMAVEIKGGRTLENGPPAVLFQANIGVIPGIDQYRASAGRKELLPSRASRSWWVNTDRCRFKLDRIAWERRIN